MIEGARRVRCSTRRAPRERNPDVLPILVAALIGLAYSIALRLMGG